jgi:hypothetical protein
MTEQSETEVPQLRRLPVEMVGWCIGEWRSRTVWGKILYPLWLVQAAFMWVALALFFGPLILFKVFSDGVDFVIDRTISAVGKATPDVYKDEQ